MARLDELLKNTEDPDEGFFSVAFCKLERAGQGLPEDEEMAFKALSRAKTSRRIGTDLDLGSALGLMGASALIRAWKAGGLGLVSVIGLLLAAGWDLWDILAAAAVFFSVGALLV